ncbi:MAG: hypothetical protein PUH90_06705 [Clostridia bacterium]|nr:hypothetical protein [Clostridia bacterium]
MNPVSAIALKPTLPPPCRLLCLGFNFGSESSDENSSYCLPLRV